MDFKNNFLKNTALATAIPLTLSNTVFNSIDPRTRALVMGISGFTLTIFSKDNPLMLSAGIGLMISFVADTLNSIRGGGVLKNNFNGQVYCKSENSQRVITLNPYETIGFYQKIDGIKTSYKPNYVYKIPDGCFVEIKENGEIVLASYWSKLINIRWSNEAGWKDENWVKEFPDWKPLLEK